MVCNLNFSETKVTMGNETYSITASDQDAINMCEHCWILAPEPHKWTNLIVSSLRITGSYYDERWASVSVIQGHSPVVCSTRWSSNVSEWPSSSRAVSPAAFFARASANIGSMKPHTFFIVSFVLSFQNSKRGHAIVRRDRKAIWCCAWLKAFANLSLGCGSVTAFLREELCA